MQELARVKESDHVKENLQQAIESTLDDLVGSKTREFLFDRIQEELQIDPSRLASNPENVDKALDQFLGSASDVVKRAVIRRAAEACGTSVRDVNGKSFAEYADDLMEGVGDNLSTEQNSPPDEMATQPERELKDRESLESRSKRFESTEH